MTFFNTERDFYHYLSKRYPKIGDDTAVLPLNKQQYQLFTSDMLVEGVHFSLKYFSPFQIGHKAIVCSVSDSAAMGGRPTSCTISLGLPHKNKDFIKKLYDGIHRACKDYGCEVVGGDLSYSKKIIISVAMLGMVEKKYMVRRKGAKPGDLLYVSHNLGESAVGLALLKKKKKGKSIHAHLLPKAHLDLGRTLGKIGVSSMIDSSDGLATSIHQLCEATGVGAIIDTEKLPIAKKTTEDCKKLKKKVLPFALYGGEDYNLVCALHPKKISKVKKLPVTVIGEITKRKEIVTIENSKKKKLRYGYDHFMKSK